MYPFSKTSWGSNKIVWKKNRYVLNLKPVQTSEGFFLTMNGIN